LSEILVSQHPPTNKKWQPGKNSSDEDEDEEDIGDEVDATSIDELTRRGDGRSQSDED